ncbi:HDOD domain-containing protein, partial [Candidatus Desantisbacteria bacterium]|nr:HDOD domain-containing protein [Candidatus Desantisbacteria bacterium]
MNNGEKVQILFVDDEQKILDGLRRMLYSMRNEWEMEFVNSGQKALEIMGKKTIDVIISDMRMPEMDGAELLNKVKQIYPRTIRFILSGYSDKDMILRTIDAADQFLTKPCNSDLLKKAIQKSIGVTVSQDKAKIHEFISKIKILPVLPDLYKQLINLVESDKSSSKEVSEIIKKDVIMIAKVLQLVNSAFFGLPNHISDIYQAVSYLGMDTIKSIVITVKAFGEFSKEEMDKFQVDDLYQHSCRVGILSGKIINSIVSERKLFEEA